LAERPKYSVLGAYKIEKELNSSILGWKESLEKVLSDIV
jgi:dTDP-4-dehydrorhamnose reductase